MRIFINIIGIIFLILIGTIGYILIEKINFIDALYQTVITITTVGFREVKPLTNLGKIFTIFYLIFGLGFVSYTILNIGQKFFETTLFDFLTRSRRSLRKMEGHFIICGFGRLGQFVSKELEKEKKEFIVIEKSPECIEILREKGYAFIEGDAREEEILLKAGIKRAKGIATLLGNDADNLYIVFTARELNPHILIVSKAEDELSYKKLIKAGANRVILPYEEGGIKIAQTLLRPNLLEFVDFIVQRQHLTLRVEEIEIKEDHEFSGKKLRDSGLREKYGMIAIAIRKGDNMIFNPGPEEILNPGDIIILMGEIKGEEVGIGGLYISYAIILAAIPAIANLIGTAFIGYSVMGIYFRVPFGNALGSAILSYILSLIGIYIVALIADALAPGFDSKKNITNAFKATVFSMTPYWVAGILYIIPALSPIVLIAGLYGIYLFYLGLPLLMETPKEKALPYVIIVIVVTFIINLIIGLITSAIFMPRGIGRVM